MHRAYFEAGAHVVETNTFGAFGVPLAEYDLAERTRELNQKAAGLASEVAEEMSSPGDPRLVAGSIGPGTKFASLGNIRYAELRDLYHEQALGLLEGGIDLFIIETQFDLLGAKAAMNGCRAAMREPDQAVPLQVQVTMELTGRMLPGTEIGAALVGPRRDATRRDRHSTARPVPARCTSTSATCPSTPGSPSRACPTPGCRRWSTARCTTT